MRATDSAVTNSPAMSSNQVKDEGPSKSADSASQDQAQPKLPQSSTPRVPLFSDADEAYRRIVTKNSNNPFRKGKHTQVEAVSAKSQDDLPLQTAAPVVMAQDTEVANGSSAPVIEMPAAVKDSSTLTQFLQRNIEMFKAAEPIESSSSTVEKIVDQYTTNARDEGSNSVVNSESGSSISAAYPLTAHPGSAIFPLSQSIQSSLQSLRQGAPTRLGFRGEEKATNGIRRWQVGSDLSDAPSENPPSVPKGGRRRSKSLSGIDEHLSYLGSSTLSDSQNLLDAEAQVNDLHGTRLSPLNSPFQKNSGEKSTEVFSDLGSNSVDITTGSNIDPFKYDRDISRRLRRASKLGGTSDFSMLTPEVSPYHKTGTKNTELPKSEQSDEIPSDVVTSKKVQELKVYITRKPEIEDDTPDSRLLLSRGLNTLPKESSGDGEWVTELTSSANPSSADLFKATGSSIADYSDNDRASSEKKKGRALPTLFSSRRLVLQHPLGQNQAESHHIRDIKGTGQAVSLPRTDGNRLAASPNNSTRLFSTKVAPSNPFGRMDSYQQADPAAKFSFKLKPKGPSKFDFRDSVSSHAPTLHRDQIGSGIPRSNYQKSLFTGIATDYNNGEPGTPAYKRRKRDSSAMQAVQSTPKKQRRTPEKQEETRLVDQAYPVRYDGWWQRGRQEQEDEAGFASSTIGEPASARSKFEFELLPLHEAQRKQRQQRESGANDETQPASVRYQNAISSRNVTPSGPINRPMPTYAGTHGGLAPRLSTEFFGHDSWQALRDALQGKKDLYTNSSTILTN